MRKQEETSIDGALQRSVGECGYGQIRIYLLVNMVWVVTALQAYMMNFTEMDSVLEKGWQCTSSGHTKCAKLFSHGDEEHGLKEEFCKMHPQEWEWIDRDSSIISEFSIECDEDKIRIVRQLFFLGQFLGSGMLGYTADKIGRQPALLLSVGLSGFSTLLTAFAPSYWTYSLLRFLTGFGAGGQIVSSFVLWTEFVGPSKRGKLGIAVQILFSVGRCLLVAIAYLLGAWRATAFACGVFSLTFFLILMWIPESPRWLLIRGRKGEAAGVLAAIASANRTKLPEVPLAEMAAVGNTDRMLVEVLKHKRLREWLLIVLATWFSLSTVQSGIFVLLGTIPDDNYFEVIATAIVEILAYLVYLILVDRVGRQPLFVWGLVIGGACCICSWIVPRALLLIVIITGKFAASGAFAVAFLYTTEMFPTSVRGASLGAASLAGRAGGLVATGIVYIAEILGPAVPLIVFGILGLAAGALALGLPETIGAPLPDTVESISIAPGPRRRWSCWGRKKQAQNYSKLDEDTIT